MCQQIKGLFAAFEVEELVVRCLPLGEIYCGLFVSWNHEPKFEKISGPASLKSANFCLMVGEKHACTVRRSLSGWLLERCPTLPPTRAP